MGGTRNFHRNPYLNGTTVPFDNIRIVVRVTSIVNS